MWIDGMRYVLRPGTELFLDSEGTLHLLPRERSRVTVPAPAGRLVWQALHGAAIPARTDARTVAALERLVDEELALPADAVASAATRRWQQQVSWFAQETGEGPERQHRLGDSRVMVIGAGGIGAVVAEQLARAGVGALTLVDHEHVDPVDRSRRAAAAAAGDAGRPNVDVAAELVAAVAPEVEVRKRTRIIDCAAAASELLATHDPHLVVLAMPRTTASVIAAVEYAASVQGTAVLHVAQRAPYIDVGPMFIPGIAPCFACFTSTRTDAGHDLEPELVAYRELQPMRGPTVPWGDISAAGLVAGQAVQWLAGVAPDALLGRQRSIDLRTLEGSWREGPPLPMCLRCDAATSRAFVR